MKLGVLGPLSVVADSSAEGVNLAPSAPKLRSVLAMLTVYGDQVVPVALLMRELWDGVPPTSGLNTLQTYILGVRKLLSTATGVPVPEVASEILTTEAGGYLLRTEYATLDLKCYHTLVAAGREALMAEDDQRGVRLLSQALRLWRGPALVDVPAGPALESKRRQLEASHDVIREYRLDAQLRLGHYGEILGELAELTAQNPLGEGIHVKYMQALHLSGRRTQALEVFHRLRGNLVAELGLEPGRLVQQAYRAILDPDLDFDEVLTRMRPNDADARTLVWGHGRRY